MSALRTYKVGIVYTFQAEDEQHAVDQFTDTVLSGHDPWEDPANVVEAHVNVLEQRPTVGDRMAALHWRAIGYMSLPGMRRGQAYCNALGALDPDLSYELSSTGVDPFYDDGNLDAFLAEVSDRWGQE